MTQPNIQQQKYTQYIADLRSKITASNVDDRIEVAYAGFIELSDILKWTFDQNKEVARDIQLGVCEITTIILGNNPDAIEIALETRIVKELMQLLGTVLPLEEVTFSNLDSVLSLAQFGTVQQRHQLFELGLPQAIIRNLKSQDSNVTEKTAGTIYKVVSGPWYQFGFKCLHPQYE
ncbi:MAG: hypothetical protein EZS28_046911, partial [Streblomastix strix]